MLTLNDRHPDKDATTIDYSVSNFMLPTVLLGSIIGVFANKLLPELVIQSMLFVVLAWLAIDSAKKAKRIYEGET